MGALFAELAGPNLRAAQVLQYRHGVSAPFGGGAHARADGGVGFVRTVREVQAEDVDPRVDELVEHRVGTAGRTERGDDLGMPHGVQLTIVRVMDQVVPEAIARYIGALHPPVEALLEEIDREGRAEGLPLVNAASARLLRRSPSGAGRGAFSKSGRQSGTRPCGSPGRFHPTGT